MDSRIGRSWGAPKRPRLAFSVFLLILVLVIWFSPWIHLRYTAAFVFLWVLPGLGWVSLLPPRALNPVERLAVGPGLSFVVTPITILLLYYLPGSMTQIQILVAVAGVAILPLLASTLMDRVRSAKMGMSPPSASEDRPWLLPRWRTLMRGRWGWPLLAVLMVIGLRVVNLGYSEFQGDEAQVVLRAAYALEGDESILFQHMKGPAELTLIMGTWRLTGMISEWMARLPFAWANLLGLVAVFLLCRRLGQTWLGAIAVALLAIEGYLVAFGRIVQYQSLVFGLCSLGLLCLMVFHATGQRSLVFIAAALFAGGFLAHYDAMLMLPAGLMLLSARLWADRRNLGRAMFTPLVAASIGLVLVGLFYLPFLQSTYMDHTSSYVSGRLGAGFSNNQQVSFVLSAVYDSMFYLIAMLMVLATTLLATWARWGPLGRLVGGALLLAAASTVLWPERWLVGQVAVAWIPHAILLLGAILAPGQPMLRRAVWAWFAAPWLFYLFATALPLTHVHVFFPAWAILVAFGVTDAMGWLARRPKTMRRMFAVLAIAFYLVCIYYPIMMFVDHTPEYRRTFPEFKHAVYWTPYEEIPEHGLFGFPYRVGWKVVGYLRDAGILDGNYDTNEESAITDYYTRRAPRWKCPTPDVYITATNVQDEEPLRWYQIDSEYQPSIRVTVGGEEKLVVHQRTLTSASGTYAVEDYAWLFDRATTPERLALVAPAAETAAPEQFMEQDFTLDGIARLIGYQLNSDHAVPGGYVDLVLRWEVLASAPADYTVFTHLYNGAAMLGQLDGQPVCGTRPTTTWQPGEIVTDAYRIPVKGDASLGPVPLYVGMYVGPTGERLPVLDSHGQPLEDRIYLTDVSIQSP